jgi:uncharacterized membrane protein YhaH (DUF805 family)
MSAMPRLYLASAMFHAEGRLRSDYYLVNAWVLIILLVCQVVSRMFGQPLGYLKSDCASSSAFACIGLHCLAASPYLRHLLDRRLDRRTEVGTAKNNA